MRTEVQRFMAQEQLLAPGQAVWVAVSGGVDSMVLLHVLKSLGHECHVAHVDHGLRGAESTADQEFVQSYCQEHALEFEAIEVDAAMYAMSEEVSIEMAGRQLRYGWFAQLLAKGPNVLATGHHRDDAVETLLLNLLRGPGLHGWSGIPCKAGAFVRPLLCVDRAAILAYAKDEQVPFREDASNADTSFLRNRVRHEVLPLLEQLRPGARRVLGRSLDTFREMEEASTQHVDRTLAGIVPAADGSVRIPFDRIQGSGTPHLVLSRVLVHAAFHPDVLEQLREAILERRTGTEFISGSIRVVVDRDALLISTLRKDQATWLFDPEDILPPGCLVKCALVGPEDVDLGAGPFVAWLDADRLVAPLELRPWREGDRIRPIGLGGSKLISDILIDTKVPRPEKERTHVLCCEGEVVWCVGHRIREGSQATGSSRRVLRMEWLG